MIRWFYHEELDRLDPFDDEFFRRLRAQSENLSSDPDNTEEIEFLEEKGYREADALTLACYFGIVHDWDSADAWFGGKSVVDGSTQPTHEQQDGVQAAIAAMIDALRRIGW